MTIRHTVLIIDDEPPIRRLIQAVVRFLNRWRLGKERFEELSARQQALRGALETNAEQVDGKDR